MNNLKDLRNLNEITVDGLRTIIRQELASLNRVRWKVDRTDSGIQLAGGSTTVYKYGTIISTVPTMLSGGQQILLFFVKGDDDSNNLVSVDDCEHVKPASTP